MTESAPPEMLASTTPPIRGTRLSRRQPGKTLNPPTAHVVLARYGQIAGLSRTSLSALPMAARSRSLRSPSNFTPVLSEYRPGSPALTVIADEVWMLAD